MPSEVHIFYTLVPVHPCEHVKQNAMGTMMVFDVLLSAPTDPACLLEHLKLFYILVFTEILCTTKVLQTEFFFLLNIGDKKTFR